MDINMLISLSITSELVNAYKLGLFVMLTFLEGDEDGCFDIILCYSNGTMKYKNVKIDGDKKILELPNSVIINDRVSLFANHIYDAIFVKKTAHIMKGGY